MIITLDGHRLTTSITPDCTLQTLIQQVREAHLPERLIVSVAVDGRNLTDDDLRTALERPVTAEMQVDLESGDSHELVRDALRGLALEFAAAPQQLAGVADRLASTQSAQAVRDVGDCITLWQTCHHTLVQCSGLINQDLTQCACEGRTLQAWFEEALRKLGEVRQALESRDLVLLSDLVRYELSPLCEAWQGGLNSLAEQICPVASPA